MFARSSSTASYTRSVSEPPDHQQIVNQPFIDYKSKQKLSTVFQIANESKETTKPLPTLQNYQREWQLKKCEMVNVNFVAHMPRECCHDECQVHLKFFLHLKKENTFHPVKINYELNMIQLLSLNNELFYHIETKAKLPLFKHTDNLQIGYFYSMDHPASIDDNSTSNFLSTPEYNFLKLYEIRTISFDHNRSSHDHIDGVVYFNPNLIFSNADQAKSEALHSFLKLETLFSRAITDPTVHMASLERVTRAYKCLCSQDMEYKKLFESLCSNHILGFLKQMSEGFQVQEWSNYALLSIVYMAYEFDLNVFSDMEILGKLFSFHKPINVQYFKEASNHFVDEQLQGLLAALRSYLKREAEKQGHLSGINAYMVYYYLSNSLWKKGNSDFLKFRLEYPEYIDKREIFKYLDQYKTLILEDFKLGALFLTYFPIDQDLLMDYFRTQCFFTESFIHFMHMLLKALPDPQSNINREWSQLFRTIINQLVKTIDTESFDSERYYKLISSVEKLLGETIKCAPKNTDLIADLVNYCLRLFIVEHRKLIEQHASSTNPETESLRKHQFHELRELFQDRFWSTLNIWVRKECNESLLVNYGLERRSARRTCEYNDQQECLKCIRELRLYTKHDTNTRLDSDMTIRINRIKKYYESIFATDSRSEMNTFMDEGIEGIVTGIENYVQMNKIYIGTEEEVEIYNALLSGNQDLNEEYRSKQMKKQVSGNTRSNRELADYSFIAAYNQKIQHIFDRRLTERSEIDYSEIITYRNKFQFNRFKFFANEFRTRVDKCIHERLNNKKNPRNLEILAGQLKDNLPLLKQYTNSLLTVQWPRNTTDKKSLLVAGKDLLSWMFSWEPFLCLVELAIKGGPDTVLSPEWRMTYETSFKYLGQTIRSVIEGEQKLCVIKLFNSNESVVAKITNFMVHYKVGNLESIHPIFTTQPFDSLKLVRILNFRNKEVLEFEAYRVSMKAFIQYAKKFPQISVELYTRQLEELQSLGKEIENMQLNSVCIKIPYESIVPNFQLSIYIPYITHFKAISPDLMQTIVKIINLDSSKLVLFNHFFKFSCDELVVNKKSLEINESVKKLWELTVQKLRTIIEPIESGSVKLVELDNLLNQFFNDNFVKMQNEVNYLLDYYQIRNLNERKNQISLWDSFKSSHKAAKTIETIHANFKLETKFTQLNDLLAIDTNVYTTWNLLKMNSEMAAIIQVLSSTNSPEKLVCLKAFAESTDLVNWLRKNAKSMNELKVLIDLISASESTTGPNRTIVAKTLLEACSAYASLIYDLKLNDGFFKFVELAKVVCSYLSSDRNIATKLNWCRDNVPLSLLDEIQNSKGDVEISSLKRANKINNCGVYKIISKSNEKMEVADLITLELLDDSDSPGTKVYTYEELKDLQSILMLFAPRKKQDTADEEIDVTLARFIETFAGVTHLAEVYISLEEHGCSFFDRFELKIFCGGGRNMVTSLIKVNGCTIEDKSVESIRLLTKFMEDSLHAWLQFLGHLRDIFVVLNHFTIDQIRYLSSSIAQQIRKPNTSYFRNARSMLHNLCPNFKLNLLKKVFNKTLSKSPPHALKEEFLVRTNIPNLDTAWSEFIQSENSIGQAVNEEDFHLTLRHIGVILTGLKACGGFKEVQRRIPGYLNQKNEPSLITCSQKEQIPIVMSMYAYDAQAPMPTNEELIYCDWRTTYEKIEIFLRRVFVSRGARIYAILNIQELNYEAANKLENNYQKLAAKRISDDFCLVFVCCVERQTDSIIASLFLNNKINPVNFDDEHLREYLNRNLMNESNVSCKYSKHNVRTLISQRSGNGKSLYVKKLMERFTTEKNLKFNYKIIRIKEVILDMDDEILKLFNNTEANDESTFTIYHIDIAYEVLKHVDQYLFNLIICRTLSHSKGLVWRRNPKDIYLIEMSQKLDGLHTMVKYLPYVEFPTPVKYLYDLKNSDEDETIQSQSSMGLTNKLFQDCFMKEKYQRCCYYLTILYNLKNCRLEMSDRGDEMTVEESIEKNFDPERHIFTEIDCLDSILKYSKLNDPNWLELVNFVHFLNIQLVVCEESILINKFKCLRNVCIQLVTIMANDFGLPSLNMHTENQSSEDLINFEAMQINESRRWENMAHPYIIFHSDRNTMCFLGIYLDRFKRKFMNPNTGQPIQQDISVPEFTSELILTMLTQRLKIFDSFNGFIRETKLMNLSRVMGLDEKFVLGMGNRLDGYELTLDNCLKMMAIYLRFIAGHPVFIMGETGCGKTCLIKFFCALNIRGTFQKNNLIHVKIHGGTRANDLEQKLSEAELLARQNYNLFKSQGIFKEGENDPITAVLFFDEANTTESIGLIKEVMCDFTCNGRQIDTTHGLKIIAAINPYKKHSEEMIQKLEQAGLGFFVSADDTKEKFGHIPMRQLVYRVQPLPSSLLPLVWDFGQLEKSIENTYISQMLLQASKSDVLPKFEKPEGEFLCKLICASQEFMRQRNDECSFVSIRDIERVIKVTGWFLRKKELIFSRMNNKKLEGFNDNYQNELSELQRAFVLALSVCYHSCLQNTENREQYREKIQEVFPLNSQWNTNWLLCEILKCQNIFMDEINLKINIARNSALLENVFMMIVCIELRIPLFIVGKPGSSKSLAKSIVTSAMEGRNSKSIFFQNFKQTYFVNFQCSPLTTSEMIVKAFKRAAKFQESNDLESSVAVVNLDEIGLAEGSESMPLKSLHSLLEEGVNTSETDSNEHNKVSVIGISNWALDPAKMNRGLFVSRGEPDIEQLVISARGICNYDKSIFECIQPHIKEIAEAYLELCESARMFKREFFGLRDYYSLIKMLYWFCAKDKHFTWFKLEHAVLRNFNGLAIDIMAPFKKHLQAKLDNRRLETDPKCAPIDLIESALKNEHTMAESVSRYLLFLTENSSAIDIIQNFLLNVMHIPVNNLSVIFGSSFRNDQQYSEICRNISLIKHSMEIGNIVILLNSYNLYESLYDALNQYYYELAGQKFVDLGLGTHSVKAAVHDNFRLIVIAEKEAVYDAKRFPIPLINRLEKHFLTAANMLNQTQLAIRNDLDTWVRSFVRASLDFGHPKTYETFIGFHGDTTSSLILHLSEEVDAFHLFNAGNEEQIDTTDTDGTEKSDQLRRERILLAAKRLLLKCATPDSVIRSCSSRSLAAGEKEFLWQEYFVNQRHLSLSELLLYHIQENCAVKSVKENSKTQGKEQFNTYKNLIQVSTNSKITLLNIESRAKLRDSLGSHDNRPSNSEFCILKAFDTMLQFTNRIKQFLQTSQATPNTRHYLFIQTDINHESSTDIIACARHTIVESLKEVQGHNYFIVLLINLPKEHVENFIGFQLSHWSCYHLDEIDAWQNDLPGFESMRNKCLSAILEDSLDDSARMDTGNSSSGLSMAVLLKRLAHNACSLIKDTNLARTIHRINVFMRLCGNEKFVEIAGKRLISLQRTKDQEYSSNQGKDWLTREAANIKSISEYSTLRRSCQFYFESKLSPLLAYLLSFIDQFSNLETFASTLNKQNPFECWTHDLWLSILDDQEICRIDYANMRSDNKEMSHFNCQSDLSVITTVSAYHDQAKLLKPGSPFFWILINQLSNLHDNLMESLLGKNETIDLTAYAKSVVQFFEESSIFILLKKTIENHTSKMEKTNFYGLITKSYIEDFVLKKCTINSRRDLEIVANIMKLKIERIKGVQGSEGRLEWTLPVVHYLYDEIKSEIDMYLKFASFDQKLNDSEFLKNDELLFCCNDQLQLSYNSCINTIELFKQELNSLFISKSEDTETAARRRLGELIKLLSQIILHSNNDHLYGQYELLELLFIFLDNFIMISKQDQSIAKLLNQMIRQLTTVHFATSVDFRSAETVISMHEFLIASKLETTDSELANRFQESLNTFYVNVIELLVFRACDRAPTENAIHLVLTAITDCKLKTATGDLFLIRPIHRSLLIRIIFRSYPELVVKHLKTWYNQASANKDMFQTGEDLATLFQDCVYDEHIHKVTNLENHQQLQEAIRVCGEIKQIQNSQKIFMEKKMYLKMYNVDFLLCLAKLKFCIFIMARVAHSSEHLELIANQVPFEEFNEMLRELVEKHFHYMDKNEVVINYMIKELIRSYGSSSINYVLTNPKLNWITPKHLIDNEESSTDKYVISSRYLTFKEAIMKSFKEKKSTFIDETITSCSYDYRPYLLMALYQNVTLLYRNIGDVTVQILDIFQPIESRYFEDAEHLTRGLFKNTFTHNLKVSKENHMHMDLSQLLMEIKFTVLYSNCGLVGSLKAMLKTPGDIALMYLPTMPGDEEYDVKRALQENTTTKFYVCPNGHQYAIGECGQPWIKAVCAECGLEIGGVNHSLIKSNKRMDDTQLVDHTLTGYLLSSAQHLSDKAQTVRFMSSLHAQIVRFFLHACMYLACGDEDQEEGPVRQSIIMTTPDNVKQFFWEHMLKDLRITCRELNITVDELLMLLHSVCFKFIVAKATGPGSKDIQAQFTSKSGRQQWEGAFANMYLQPVFSKVSENILLANNAIKRHLEKDDSNQSKMYFMAYELIKKKKSEILYENEQFWKFRPLVSFSFMAQELRIMTKPEQFKVLKRFAQLIDSLELVFQLPSIMEFLNMLKQTLNKRFFRHKAQACTIGELFEMKKMPEDWTVTKLQEYVKSLQKVWSAIKPNIHSYIFSKISGSSVHTVNSSIEFNFNSNLSYFLPTLNGDGLHSYTLLHYLASIHNDMITFFLEIKKEKNNDQKLIEDFENKEFIIRFEKETDLLDLVQSNFSYDSRNLKCLFQYKDIENQLVDRYLRRKPLINIEKLPVFEYADEIHDDNIFERLEAENKQMPLEQATMTNLVKDFTNISEISEELNTLKILINYASTTTADSNMTILSLINKIYLSDSNESNSQGILKSKSIQQCGLKHIKHAWILLNVKRCILYTNNNQDPFKVLRDSFKVEREIKFKINLEPGMILEVLSVLYQIITKYLYTEKTEEATELKKISDYFQYLSSLDVVHSEAFDSLPPSFPDDRNSLEESTSAEDKQDPTLNGPYKMANIYSMWKHLCTLKI